MKKLLTIVVLVFSVSITNFNLLNAQCLNQWQYAMPIDITNTTGSDLHNYQVKISVNTDALVSAGKMQSNGNDIRFYVGDCCSLMSFFIDSAMNTPTTKIWVKVPFIPASGMTTIRMAYGNPAATSASDPNMTFDLWEPFDLPVNHFSPDACGSGTYNVAGGEAATSWPSQYSATSDITFDKDTTYIAEGMVTAASGNWPGIHWQKTSDNRGYGILLGGGNVRISKTGASTGYCQGHNWASGLFSFSITTGLWSATWISSGSQEAIFPGGLNITSADTEHPKDTDMKLAFGGCSSGSGNMSLDWLRARKYAASLPALNIGTEVGLSFLTVSLGSDTSICNGSILNVDAGAGFASYSWNTGSSSQNINIDTAGVYFVTAVDVSMCASTDTITVGVNPLPIISLGSDLSICPGDSSSIDAGAGFSSYLWNGGATTQTILVPAGTYSVMVEDVNSCTNSDTITIGNYTAPTSSFTPGITGLSVNFTNTSTGGNTYLWNFGDGDTSTAFSPSHTFATTNTYNVCLTVTSDDGCETTTCSNVSVTNAGLNSFEDAGIELYPNPAKDICWLVLPENMMSSSITLIDMTGKKISVTNHDKTGTVKIETSALEKGIYIVQVINGDLVYSQRLVVQ